MTPAAASRIAAALTWTAAVVAGFAAFASVPAVARSIEIEATRPLGIREGLTAAVAWNPGVVRRPSAIARWLTSWGSWFVGRDPRPGPLTVEYGPPDGLGPAEAGTLIDNKPDTRDLMAGLVDAAVKGVVRIRKSVEKSWFRRPGYLFDLLVPESFWDRAGITASSQAMLRGMFYLTNGPTRDDGAISTVSSSVSATFFL